MTTLPAELQHLIVLERIALAQALWDSIADQARLAFSEAKRVELTQQAAEDDVYPDEIVPWEWVKAEILDRLAPSIWQGR